MGQTTSTEKEVKKSGKSESNINYQLEYNICHELIKNKWDIEDFEKIELNNINNIYLMRTIYRSLKYSGEASLEPDHIIKGINRILIDDKENGNENDLNFICSLSEDKQAKNDLPNLNFIKKDVIMDLLKGLELELLRSFGSKMRDYNTKLFKDIGLLVDALFKSDPLLPAGIIFKFLNLNLCNWFLILKLFITAKLITPNIQIAQLNIPLLDTESEILRLEDIYCLTICLLSFPFTLEPQKWSLLYKATKHGFSTNRLETQVLKYPGSTLLILRCESRKSNDELILVVKLSKPWQRSKSEFNNSLVEVVEIEPNFRIFSNDGSNGFLFNPVKGVFIGKPSIIKIDSSMNSIIYNPSITLSSSFKTLPSVNSLENNEAVYNLIEIEIYGLDGDSALAKQKREWDFERQEQQNRNRIQAFENPNSKESRRILEMAGIIKESEDMEKYRAVKYEK